MRPTPRNSRTPDSGTGSTGTGSTGTAQLLDSLPDAVVLLNADLTFTYVNSAAAAMLGRPVGDVLGRTLDEVFLPGTAAYLCTRMQVASDNGGSASFEDFSYTMQKWLSYRITAIEDGYAIWARDITEGRATPKPDRPTQPVGLDWTSPFAQNMLDTVPAGVVVLDYDGVIVLANRSWTNFWSGKPDGDMFGPGYNYFDVCEQSVATGNGGITPALIGLKQLARGEIEQFTFHYHWDDSDGELWFQLRASRLSGSDGIYLTHTDISDLVGNRTLASADTDILTGLANRAELERLLNHELQSPSYSEVSVLLVDIDGFSEYNDALGHDHGDEVLRLAAARLTESVRPQDTVGRWEGDEFVVIARGCSGLDARNMAAEFGDAFGTAFDVAGRRHTLTVGVGVATSTETTGSAIQLIHDAAAAMHAAKAVGRGREHVFTPGLRASRTQRFDLIERLRHIANISNAERELEMMYQPIVDLATSAMVGTEALVRWHHPELGLLMPDSFIPLAEESGLIVPLSMWILDEVTRSAAAWQSKGLNLQVGVNISPLHLAAGTLTDDVIGMIDGLGIAPGNLVLEISESQTLYDLERVADQLRAVRSRGALIAIDDFGTGFSSLERLATLPVDMIKIDKSLTQHLDSRQPHRRHAVHSLLRAVVDVSRDLNQDTVVEGIETNEQLRMCIDLGITFGQGHLLGRPMPAPDLEALACAARNSEPRSATA